VPERNEFRYPTQTEGVFKTPEEVAAIDEKTKDERSYMPQKPRKKQRRFIAWFKGLSGNKKFLFIGGILVLIVLIGFGAYIVFGNKTLKSTFTFHAASKPAAPTTVASTLTGLQVAPDVNKRPVTAIMIENSDAARPQSGLDQAGVVFEAIAEGGVTRFMALFQDTQPGYIGPVRSARPYYIQWALGFDASYAHVGGSPDALADLSTWNVKNLDQFYNASAYQRITSRDAPHNVYTSIASLNSLETSKGYGTSTYTGFARKADSPAKTVNAGTIDLTLSGPDFNPHYDYVAASNSYNRSEGGQPHMELSQSGTQTQIKPKVVIAMVTPLSQGALDATGAYYSDYNVLGNGKAYIFQDGTVTVGSWQKGVNTDQISFVDAQGNPIKLNAGQTWITAVGSDSDVSYK
jgi:hypothetical protein